MGSNYGPLHIFFFPFMAHGHMIPLVDMAKLFAAKGVRTTIITTPLNAPIISKTIEQTKTHQSKEINIQTIKFPNVGVGLPEGCEHSDSVLSTDLFPIFLKATTLMQEPFEQLLLHQRPNCVVADWFFPWTTDSAAKFGIPRLVFHGISFFSLCATKIMSLYKPYNNTCSDSELFVIPNFPGEIKMTRLQVGNFHTKDNVGHNSFWNEAEESEERSYGVVVNSFYELEKDYADHYRNVHGRKAWHIGPLSLCNRNKEEKIYRGKEASIDEHECLKWLDTQTTNSVVYVCFGSAVKFSDSQLLEIAMGLEASGQQFIWVVRKSIQEKGEKWLPEGFEKRMEGKGLIIRGWAPQVLILEHEAIGAFVTHCGWNSTLEAVSAGVPMITWPVGAEQFFNEKLVTEVLKIGVPVGVKKWSYSGVDCCAKWDVVEKAVKMVFAKELEGMRKRAKVLAQMARRAVEEGGSSDSNLDVLIQELGTLSSLSR
ncbi:scopoletin glucosyltransferase-like [Glycine soja]|uniref:Glycosyltransferase n=2 Tax=Glycine soja TaxID=3848 RepID=A0A0B2PX22_GLYSO|nr:scopoletin glucosyltransferase-like [Glycine soja]KHN12234.1 UDP-glucose flavonoid 3-O-glucosyltransferase 7 [Glycine soja]